MDETSETEVLVAVQTEQLPELPPKKSDKLCNGRNKAHTKYCKNVAGYKTDHVGTGRCFLHGGASVKGVRHYNFKDGRYSKVMPQNLVKHYETTVNDSRLLELRDDIALVAALISDSLSDLQENYKSSLQYFKLMATLLNEISIETDMASGQLPDILESKIKQFGELFYKAQAEHAKRQELLIMVDQKRKLTESERKRLLELHSLFSAEQVMAMMGGVLSIIRENVSDLLVQERIAEGIRKLINQSNQKQLPK